MTSLATLRGLRGELALARIALEAAERAHDAFRECPCCFGTHDDPATPCVVCGDTRSDKQARWRQIHMCQVRLREAANALLDGWDAWDRRAKGPTKVEPRSLLGQVAEESGTSEPGHPPPVLTSAGWVDYASDSDHVAPDDEHEG
ncbi:MAG: hypothetical protein CMD39_07295 [Gammaproteobacteria bacterium]|nr:hypothetical protein [Gammaproteobacteria bacterium]